MDDSRVGFCNHETVDSKTEKRELPAPTTVAPFKRPPKTVKNPSDSKEDPSNEEEGTNTSGKKKNRNSQSPLHESFTGFMVPCTVVLVSVVS